MFTNNQIREQYRKLPPEVQSFIMDNETTDIIEQLLNDTGIAGEKNDSADSEILYAMYGLQDLDTSIKNIANTSGKNVTQLSNLRTELQSNIFDKLSEIGSNKSTSNDVGDIVKKEKKQERQNNVGNDFEKMIMNQVKGMMPAVEAPNNLPTAQDNTGESNNEPKPTESARKIHSYGVKEDPYREPVE